MQLAFSSRRHGEKNEIKRTMSKGDQRPQCIKDDRGVDLTVIVKLSKVLDRSDPALVVLEDVGLIGRVGNQIDQDLETEPDK